MYALTEFQAALDSDIEDDAALGVLVGAHPRQLDPDETLALAAYRHYRLLQRVHAPGHEQLSQLLSDADRISDPTG